MKTAGAFIAVLAFIQIVETMTVPLWLSVAGIGVFFTGLVVGLVKFLRAVL
jgi:hypothetical protein